MSKIVSIRKVANGGLQAEMVASVVKSGRVNVLQALNKGDERFAQTNLRRAWFPVTSTSLMELGLSQAQLAKLEAFKLGDKMEVSIENPSINGKTLTIQITETSQPDKYQREHVMSTAKQIVISTKVAANKAITSAFDLNKYLEKTGYFLDKDGNHIFSRATVTVEEQVNHTFVDGILIPENELSSYGATLAEPVKTFAEVEA